MHFRLGMLTATLPNGRRLPTEVDVLRADIKDDTVKRAWSLGRLDYWCVRNCSDWRRRQPRAAASSRRRPNHCWPSPTTEVRRRRGRVKLLRHEPRLRQPALRTQRRDIRYRRRQHIVARQSTLKDGRQKEIQPVRGRSVCDKRTRSTMTVDDVVQPIVVQNLHIYIYIYIYIYIHRTVR